MFRTNRAGKQLRLVSGCVLLAAMGGWSGLADATPGSGATGTSLSRATVADKLKIKTKGASEVINQRIVLARGGSTGWHSHPGYHLVSVKSGELTVYDDECQGRVYGAGEAVLHHPDDVHLMRNDGEGELETYLTLILPVGTQQPRIDEPAPAGCRAS